MKARIRKGMLIITVPLIIPPRKSKSGKTLVVASYGPRRTSLRVDGKPLFVIANAYVRPDGYVKREKISRRKIARSRRQTQRGSKPKARARLA